MESIDDRFDVTTLPQCVPGTVTTGAGYRCIDGKY